MFNLSLLLLFQFGNYTKNIKKFYAKIIIIVKKGMQFFQPFSKS